MCAKAEASVWKFFARTRSKTFSEPSLRLHKAMLTANRNMAKPVRELNTRVCTVSTNRGQLIWMEIYQERRVFREIAIIEDLK